jgi:Ca-activated chloride channel family protein
MTCGSWFSPSRLIAIALFTGVVAPGPAPGPRTGRIEGTVRDAQGKALRGAQVVILGTRRSSSADDRGRYAFAFVPVDTLTLRAQYIGYMAHEIRGVVVREGRTTVLDFTLSPALETAAAIEVSVADEGAARLKAPPTARPAEDRAVRRAELQPGVVGAAVASQPLDAARPYAWQFGPPPKDREEYGHLVENPFLAVAANPLSTFAADVDRASYANIRRFLLGGSLPPTDAVRIEEMVNYFTYDYAGPTGEHPVAVHTEVAAAPWRPSHRLVRIGIQAKKIATEGMPPANLVFLLDVSGSMMPANKLPLVKAAFRLLVEQLRPEDRVAIVVYAGNAGQVLPSTPGDHKAEILEAIDRLEAGGSTAGGQGIVLAYTVAQEHFIRGGNNRVVLATDGDFNVGVSGEGELVRLIEEKRESGVFLTVVSVGEGNLQDRKMEQLADHGNGNYAYIDNLLEARKVFVQELGGTLVTVAKDVKIQIEFNPARVQAYRLIGYENRLLRNEDFNDDQKDAGDMGSGHSVTALYEVIPVGVESDVEIRMPDSLRYQTVRPNGSASAGPELAYVKFRYKDPDGDQSKLLSRAVLDREEAQPSRDFTFQTAVVELGLLLRRSEYRGEADVGRVLARARESLGADENGYRAEFVRLVEAARALRVGTVARR